MLAVTVVTVYLAISSKNIVYSVVFLLCMNASLGILYYMMGAPLVALFQLAIFAGAMVVFFVITVMLTKSGEMKPLEGGEDTVEQ
jgi:NADH-quinone oxidoreductase subunit J